MDTPPTAPDTSTVVANMVSAPPKSWHRLALSLFGIICNTAVWAWAVSFIYHLPAEKLGSFTSLTTNVLYTNAVIIVFMITGRLVWEWSNSTSAVTTVATEVKHEVEEKYDRRVDPKDVPQADAVL